MRKTILVLGILLEMLVLVALYDTQRKISTGGDIVHFQVEAPVKINNEQRMYSAGTYVMTRDGLVRLSWYWVYQYWYVTVPLPIVLALFLWWISSRRLPATPAT
jgi:hypothetical protein